ncbi:bud site selection protein 6 [Ephemerocybe angulata]|uniref:Bud site selection protein 6 n=1 Tax=Ephemerocybe angulata TaxID=980116 RepID=A0A8H6ID87_9AGAR|nr:bud site selection protein 6 [Tulosesus angulatus]
MSSRGQQQANGHSRRDAHSSISSATSTGSSRTDRAASTRSGANPAVESAVTRLLVSIKALLESLTQWSQSRVDENYVSDVYVRLGNDFNAAVAAFAAFNIDMAELVSVPEDLRAILEQCLAEEATAENLEIYLPEVRQIITNLLQGLRAKQSIYRRIVSDHRHRSGDGAQGPGHERTASKARTHKSHASVSRSVAEDDGGNRQDGGAGSLSRRSAAGSTRNRRDVNSQQANNNNEPFIGGFAPTIAEYHAGTEAQTIPDRRSSPRPLPPPGELPATVKRYSLVDRPTAASPPPTLPTVNVVEPSSPTPDLTTTTSNINGSTSPSTENIPLEPSPAVANSLAALKKNDVLERRASKRFSIYNISKMTGASTTRERSVRNHPNRRSLASNAPPTATELEVLTEEADEEAEMPMQAASRSRPISRVASPERPAKAESSTSAGRRPMDAVSNREGSSSRITVFLQLGREVKKVAIEPPLSFASFRITLGKDNFPAIYIRDPSSGVQYELEDVEEVQDKCLLSLNIEALDQIKQHIDSQMSALSQDIKDLKTAVVMTPMMGDMTIQPLAESTPARPSDRQFQHVARRLSRFVGKDPSMIASMVTQQSSPPTNYVMPQITGGSMLQQQMTGASVMSEYTGRVVQDLKTQFDEVQNLRRDLATLRQIYTEFMKSTKETLGTLRSQTQSVKQLATTNIGGARAYIDSGKKKLDARSQDVLTDVEKLQDTVERVKDDVIKRNTTPKPCDIEATAAELESLKEHIKTVKPMWKKTWEEELQNIVEEQQFLTHQEEFLSDLVEDHKAVMEIYGHVEKITNGPTRVRGRGPAFRPPPPEEGHNGLSTVMLEIRGAQVDPEKRLKAIEESQRNRELEKSMKGDDMQLELQEFVGQKKLRMTGGAEEVERLRQKKDEMNLKTMFNPGNSLPSLHVGELDGPGTHGRSLMTGATW